MDAAAGSLDGGADGLERDAHLGGALCPRLRSTPRSLPTLAFGFVVQRVVLRLTGLLEQGIASHHVAIEEPGENHGA